MSHFIYCYAECRYAEYRYAERRYAERRGDIWRIDCNLAIQWFESKYLKKKLWKIGLINLDDWLKEKSLIEQHVLDTDAGKQLSKAATDF